jgi:hypothetical protein
MKSARYNTLIAFACMIKRIVSCSYFFLKKGSREDDASKDEEVDMFE